MNYALIDLFIKYASEDPIEKWIDQNVKHPKNNCFFYSAVISLLFPDCKLIKGQHTKQYKEDTGHFYVMKDDKIIDPTKEQYDGGEIVKDEMVEVSALKNIDEIIGHKLFDTLTAKDKNKLHNLL